MVLYKVLGTAGRPVLHPVTECRKAVSSWDLYHCNQCEKRSFEIYLFYYTLLFRTKSGNKSWTTDRGFIKFDHFNAFLKLQQITYRLKACFMLITMPQISSSYD